MRVINEITQVAEKKLQMLSEYGKLVGGHNGPYYDNETPVRVSAHWIYIFSWLYDVTKDRRYYDAVEKLAKYLYEQRVHSAYAYDCRNDEKKDHVNGTIGQAWAIEGLIQSAKFLNDDKYYELAIKVFEQHKFNTNFALWNRVEIDGQLLGYDNTFNHQLWLAAAGAEIIQYRYNRRIDEQICTFLNRCEKTNLFRTYPNGVVKHFAYVPGTLKEKVKFYQKELKNDFAHLTKKPSMYYKEYGYHYFCMYGFALIYQTYKTHSIFRCKKFMRALDFTFDLNKLSEMKDYSPEKDITGLAKKVSNTSVNIYGYAYNSPCFELPFLFKVFKGKVSEKFIDEMWAKQMEITQTDNGFFERNNEDSITLEARIYELVRALM